MSIKDKIHRLENAGLDEDIIVSTLCISHLVYRRYCFRDVDRKLTASCKREVYYSELREDHTLVEIAHLYKTTYAQIHGALYKRILDRPEPTHEAVLQHLIAHDDKEATRKHFGIARRDYPQYLRAVGWEITPDAQQISRIVAAFIKNNPGMTYTEIAERFSLSKGYVARIAASNGIKRQQQNTQEWPLIVAYARAHSVSSAASHYGVSRTNIYYHMKKEEKDATED